MKKEIISDEIFYACRRATNFSKPYAWGEVKELLNKENLQLLDDDIVRIGFEEGWDEGDSARDDMYFISVKRNREETEDEFAKRTLKIEKLIEENKKLRYENYLKLKQEFESKS